MAAEDHSPVRSIIMRIINNFINAFNSQKIIPKWVVIVPECEIIDAVQYTRYGASEAYGTVLTYMMNELNKASKQIKG